MLLLEVLRKWAIIIKKLLRHFLAQIPTQEHCFTCGYLPTTIVFGHLFSSFSFLSNFWLFWYISKPYSLNSIIPPAHCSRLHSSCPSLGPCLMTRTFGIRNRRIAQDCPRYRGYHCCTLPLPPYRLPFSWTALAVCLGGFPDEQSRGHLGPDMMPSPPLCRWDAIQGSGSAPYKVSSFNKIYPHTLCVTDLFCSNFFTLFNELVHFFSFSFDSL